jgi:hyaluronan synthase
MDQTRRGHTTPGGDDDQLLNRSRRLRNVQSPVMFVLVIGAFAAMITQAGVGLSVYGVVAITYLSVKLLMSICYRPATTEPRGLTVGAVVPFYNEDPEHLAACLQSLVAQSRPVDRIFVVDDGSTGPEAVQAATQALSESGHPDAVVHRFPANRGKRHAQAWAVRRLRCDIVMTVDSDTILHPHAVREGLRPFADPDVQGVTGNVQAHNATRNLLTRLTALRYANAFLWERAAYSSVGSVLCACGSLSFWRHELVAENLEGYVNQTFLGVHVMYGDDRRLTNYALTKGKVVFQDTAIAYTTVPERFSHYARQQLRWNKSFFRETLWALGAFRPWSRVWILSLSELGLWIAFTLSLAAVVIVYPLLTGHLPSAWYFAFVAVMAYARSVRYIGSQRASVASQIGNFLLAPLYGLMYLTVLMPIRVWALFSLRNPGWGTRKQVEVRWDDGLMETSPIGHLTDTGAVPHTAPSPNGAGVEEEVGR